MKRLCRKPRPGFAWNPILNRVGRNDPCPCESGKKFKKCCKDLLSEVITVQEEDQAKEELAELGY